MYKKYPIKKSELTGVNGYPAESLELKVRRILDNKEPIKDGAPIIYTERKDGVLPSYNIRTDRFDVAVDAMDKVTRSKLAKREERAKVVEMGKKGEKRDDGGAEPIQGTQNP